MGLMVCLNFMLVMLIIVFVIINFYGFSKFKKVELNKNPCWWGLLLKPTFDIYHLDHCRD